MFVYTVQQNKTAICIYMYPLPFGLPSHSSQHSSLCRVPSAIEYAIEYALVHVFGCVLTSCYPMDDSLPGSSVHEIFQARISEWVAISYSRGSSWTRDQTYVSCIFCIGWWILYHLATWKVPMFSLVIYIIHIISSVYVSVPQLLLPPIPLCVHIFDICVSISALQIGESA